MIGLRPIFFADYRDVYDALYSAKVKISTQFLLEFLRKRGFIFSPSTSRTTLIEVVASYAYESDELDEICDHLEVHSRPERRSSLTLNQNYSYQEIQQAFDAVKEGRSVKHEALDISNVKDGRVSIKANYYEMDEGRTALRQMRPKEGSVEVLKIGDKTRLRFPGNEHMHEIATEVIEQFRIQHTDKPLEMTEIDLGTFDKLKRTEFFQKLISGIDGYKRVDVKKVSVDSEINVVQFDAESDETGEEDDVEGEEKSAEQSKVEEEIKTYLRRVSLDGNSVIDTKELKNFLSSGFFISRIVWDIAPRKRNSGKPKAELEAVLEDPKNGTGFRYAVRGIYPYKKDKTYGKRRKAKDLERDEILDILETTVQSVYKAVLEAGQSDTGSAPPAHEVTNG
jgi:hypothetical protein